LSKSQKLVKVYAASNEFEAQIIRDVLESNNIPSMLMPSINLPSAYSPMQIHGTVQVMVLESLAGKAKKLIKSDEYV
jgi:hypothetical protein